MREALDREEALLHQKDDLIQKLELLGRESDHRLLNGMQMIVSLLSMQSRSAVNAEAGSQLAVAANRVTMIERIHRRLHYLDGLESVAFRTYLDDLCRDLSTMLALDEQSEQAIVFEGIEVNLPTTTAIPLGFIVSELITNAAKYGRGRITVTLERSPGKGYSLSVANNGPVLPEEFDPAASKGLGMKIVQAFVAQIGGELRIGRRDRDQGARLTVLFAG
jgi:two-component sensor histidine kinase